MAADQRIFERLKEQTQTRTVQVLALLSLIYAFFFLPKPVLESFKEGFTSIGSVLGVAILTLVGGAAGYVISAQDLLATGGSKAANFFRDRYPSTTIMNHYQCTRGEANHLWFSIFNPWEQIPAMKDQYARTFDRGYGCRYIFVLQGAFLAFFVLALITALTTFIPTIEPRKTETLFIRALLLAAGGVITMMLFSKNSFKTPSGCWFRWKEINDLHGQWLTVEVFNHAPTYPDAVALVSNPAWRTAHGYS